MTMLHGIKCFGVVSETQSMGDYTTYSFKDMTDSRDLVISALSHSETSLL